MTQIEFISIENGSIYKGKNEIMSWNLKITRHYFNEADEEWGGGGIKDRERQ